MRVLPITFGILTVCGFWRPISLESSIPKQMYNCYSIFMCFLIYTFTLSHLIDIVISAADFESLTGSCFMLLSMMNVCCKMTNILYFRKNIVELLQILASDHCTAKDVVERDIEKKFHKRARSVTLCYWILTETTCMLITLRTFFGSSKQILPFKAWIPYEITGLAVYWTTFFHQTIAHVAAANLQIANETLICGLMIQACSQLEILKYRLKKIPDESKIDKFPLQSTVNNAQNTNKKDTKTLLVNCIDHHRRIIEFSEKLNSTFNVILFVQFAISSLVLCSSVYLLSKMKLVSVHFMSLSLYLSCMLYQIFLFCWYGNEVILQSLDLGNAVYHMDWTILSTEDKKKLLIVILLVRKPIQFTSSFLVSLSIESYCKILKTSYSVFNLLQRTSI
ncbi:odorant receptor 82 [Nasonia vitripennis]|uniref:Odorant receptor n=1 Tax=Nasonia vitripennis TaxID=7425 RepID=A0A7M6UW64_NASVI|nr:odorant receptor 82 [Nasonia vitripennis]